MMTHDEMIAEYERRIAVMKAHKEGAKIQFYHPNGYWRDCEPQWAWDDSDYRVAPEPRKALEWDVMVQGTARAVGINGVFLEGFASTRRETPHRLVRVREVLDEKE